MPGLLLARARDFVLANALIVIAVLLALLAVQTIRIDGFRIDPPLLPAFGPKGLKAENARLRADLAQMQRERDAADALAKAVASDNSRATEKANTDVKAELDRQGDRTERFIAGGGVRPSCPRTAPGGAGDRAGIDARAGALPELDGMQPGDQRGAFDPPTVTVFAEDVRICTENTVKARAWREWGLGIEANSKGNE
jgi:hypothetical protein